MNGKLVLLTALKVTVFLVGVHTTLNRGVYYIYKISSFFTLKTAIDRFERKI